MGESKGWAGADASCSDVQVGKNMFERLPLDIVLKIVEHLTLKERVRLTGVCKTWSTAGLKDWTSVEIDDGYVTASQAPLVLAFLNRLSLHSQNTLQRVTFPLQMPPNTFLPGACPILLASLSAREPMLFMAGNRCIKCSLASNSSEMWPGKASKATTCTR